MSIDKAAYALAKRNESFSNTLATPVLFPEGFTWVSNPLQEKLYRNNDGTYYHTLNTDAEFDTDGVVYYVDFSTGNDTNDGLSKTTPLKNFMTAYNKSDVGKIILLSNRLFYNLGFNGASIDKSIIIESLYGKTSFISGESNTFSKTGGYTYVYEATRANVGNVVDTFRSNPDMSFVGLRKVSSIAEVEANVDTWYTDNTKVYLRLSGDITPTNDIALVRNVYAVQSSLTAGEKIAFKNINFIGGASFAGGNVVLKDCTSQFCSVASTGTLFSGCESLIENTTSKYHLGDAIGYVNASKAIEINVNSGNCGATSDTTTNASTTHGATKIIRINGEYSNTYGPVIGDVQDDTESVNFGVVSHTSLTTTDTQNCAFQAQDGSAKMWLYDCIGYNSHYSLRTQSTAIAYKNNCKFQKAYADTGSQILNI